MPIQELLAGRHDKNRVLLSRLREDPHSGHLLEACMEDHRLGRMTVPRPLELSDLGVHTFSPRFAVEQGACSQCANYLISCSVKLLLGSGVREDGGTKVRPIDDMSASGHQQTQVAFTRHIQFACAWQASTMPQESERN